MTSPPSTGTGSLPMDRITLYCNAFNDVLNNSELAGLFASDVKDVEGVRGLVQGTIQKIDWRNSGKPRKISVETVGCPGRRSYWAPLKTSVELNVSLILNKVLRLCNGFNTLVIFHFLQTVMAT